MTLCAWLGGMYHPMSAQADQRIEEVKNLFLNKDLGVWINQYIGDNNLGHKIILTLGNDQREWKGFIQNMNTGEKLTLEGKYHRQDLKCILSDTSGKKWGSNGGDVQGQYSAVRGYRSRIKVRDIFCS
ncbi:MAG: hypothetical protein IPI30_18725 [Saprospiraceae bacterium]|nr:hypothetical protein [Candidatus Vicinibacter affinis]